MQDWNGLSNHVNVMTCVLVAKTTWKHINIMQRGYSVDWCCNQVGNSVIVQNASRNLCPVSRCPEGLGSLAQRLHWEIDTRER